MVTDLAPTTFEDACNRLFTLHADGFKRKPRQRRPVTSQGPRSAPTSASSTARRSRATSWI